MTVAQHLSREASAINRDERCVFIARHVLASLEVMSGAEITQLLNDTGLMNEFCREIWEEAVDSVVRSSGASYDQWRVSAEGALVDDLVSLWTSGHTWRRRARALVPEPAGL
jgi:hypothetical protein